MAKKKTVPGYAFMTDLPVAARFDVRVTAGAVQNFSLSLEKGESSDARLEALKILRREFSSTGSPYSSKVLAPIKEVDVRVSGIIYIDGKVLWEGSLLSPFPNHDDQFETLRRSVAQMLLFELDKQIGSLSATAGGF
jgi:hypothetical protein